MTRELALEGGPHNIRANSISPGAIETPATAPAIASSDFRARHINRIFLDRIGTVDDVAALACFLASDEAPWITGSNFVVDGGFTAR
jgi:NAD(P)-dependent dehydrogenase (short-subunit alcohol dehydrogenase family)